MSAHQFNRSLCVVCAVCAVCVCGPARPTGDDDSDDCEEGGDDAVTVLRVMIFLPPRYHLLVKAKMQRDATILDIRFVFHSPSPQQLSCKQLSWQVETARGCGCGLSLIGALASKLF
jgi:hypothetical protein